MKLFFESLIKQGYKRLDIPEHDVEVFYTGGSKDMNSFCFIDADAIETPSEEHYLFIQNKLKESFNNAGYLNYKLIFVMMSSDINHARKGLAKLDNFWLLNMETRRLIVYDGQIQEASNMRYMLEYYLENGNIPSSLGTKMKNNTDRENLTINRTNDLKYYLSASNIIIIVNVLVFIIVMLGGDVNSASYIESKGGMTVDGIKAGEYYRLFTAMFLHYGAMHLFYNMLFIFSFGNSIEPFLGKLKLFIVYFAGGLGGNIIAYYYNVNNHPNAVTAGASGAAYALMGGLIALAILDVRARHYNNPIALIVIAILFISEGFSPGSNVSNSAHIGGIVVGFFVATLIIVISEKINEIKNKNKNSM